MASSQVQCLDEEHVNPHLTESLPQFVYSEGQRRALEALLSEGPVAYARCLEQEGLWPFLSAAEAQSLQAAARPYCPSSSPLPLEDEDGLQGPDGRDLTGPWSLTYCPKRSDAPPPSLALGWPEEGLWKGITRAAVYTHPPGEGAPTIKELVRRLLQNAQQVIAIVMDQFTDIDIFLDLVDTSRLRKIPVYVLLDQDNLPLFLAMAQASSTNLWLLEFMQVRVLAGCSFCSRTGLTVNGSVKERFLLVDAEKVVTGSYSFTWTDARLHRHLATLLTGQVVDAFDREFRTLYASSRPLPREALLNGTLRKPSSLLTDPLSLPINHSLFFPDPSPRLLRASGIPATSQPSAPLSPGPRRNPGNLGNLSPFALRVASLQTVQPGPLPLPISPLAGHRVPLGCPRVSPALSDILRNLRRARTTKENGPKGSRSLWNLSALSSLSGAPSLGRVSSVDQLELGEDAKTRLLKSLPTPAATLMRHRQVQKEEEEEGRWTQPLPGRVLREFYPSRLQQRARGQPAGRSVTEEGDHLCLSGPPAQQEQRSVDCEDPAGSAGGPGRGAGKVEGLTGRGGKVEGLTGRGAGKVEGLTRRGAGKVEGLTGRGGKVEGLTGRGGKVEGLTGRGVAVLALNPPQT